MYWHCRGVIISVLPLWGLLSPKSQQCFIIQQPSRFFIRRAVLQILLTWLLSVRDNSETRLSLCHHHQPLTTLCFPNCCVLALLLHGYFSMRLGLSLIVFVTFPHEKKHAITPSWSTVLKKKHIFWQRLQWTKPSYMEVVVFFVQYHNFYYLLRIHRTSKWTLQTMLSIRNTCIYNICNKQG